MVYGRGGLVVGVEVAVVDVGEGREVAVDGGGCVTDGGGCVVGGPAVVVVGSGGPVPGASSRGASLCLGSAVGTAGVLAAGEYPGRGSGAGRTER